jgi:hypothetical protein
VKGAQTATHACDRREDPDRSDGAAPLRSTVVSTPPTNAPSSRPASKGIPKGDIGKGEGQGPVGTPALKMEPYLVPRRSAHDLSAPARAVLVKDLIGRKQCPKALYTLPVGHASSPSQIEALTYKQSICFRHIEMCEYILYGGPQRHRQRVQGPDMGSGPGRLHAEYKQTRLEFSRSLEDPRGLPTAVLPGRVGGSSGTAPLCVRSPILPRRRCEG